MKDPASPAVLCLAGGGGRLPGHVAARRHELDRARICRVPAGEAQPADSERVCRHLRQPRWRPAHQSVGHSGRSDRTRVQRKDGRSTSCTRTCAFGRGRAPDGRTDVHTGSVQQHSRRARHVGRRATDSARGTTLPSMARRQACPSVVLTPYVSSTCMQESLAYIRGNTGRARSIGPFGRVISPPLADDLACPRTYVFSTELGAPVRRRDPARGRPHITPTSWRRADAPRRSRRSGARLRQSAPAPARLWLRRYTSMKLARLCVDPDALVLSSCACRLIDRFVHRDVCAAAAVGGCLGSGATGPASQRAAGAGQATQHPRGHRFRPLAPRDGPVVRRHPWADPRVRPPSSGTPDVASARRAGQVT